MFFGKVIIFYEVNYSANKSFRLEFGLKVRNYFHKRYTKIH